MITFKDDVFKIDTESSSYVFGLNHGMLESMYYGKKIKDGSDYYALREKSSGGYPNTVLIENDDKTFVMDNLCLEYSFPGKGDFRNTAVEIRMPDSSFVCDFRYSSHKIYDGGYKIPGLPFAIKGDQTLEVNLIDLSGLELILYYTVFSKTDVIARSVCIKNGADKDIYIRKIMSMQLDLSDRFKLLTFNGLWARERHKDEKNLSYGEVVCSSVTGASSNRQSPFMVLADRECTQSSGCCIGYNLIYSSNHYESVQVSGYDKTRFMGGINPAFFEWRVGPNDTFFTPQAVISFSSCGLNGLSQNMHGFVRENIIRGEWAKKERPVLINNWEATYFNFDEKKLLEIAKVSKDLGIELLVLDDGWFGLRNDDTTSLGDWYENRKKLPGGLSSLAEKINEMGMMFGLWFEPEMVSPISDLYAIHPEWAVKVPSRKPSLGRNQLVLDLTRKDVRDYIVNAVSNILNSANIQYVKWDMNRHITDAFSQELGARQGEFYHRYILGLYDILERVCGAFPHVLFESCASGGDRFDLGMLCYMPQIWCSDNTDYYERVLIQEGTSYGFPLCTMGAHVSAVPNHQTMRTTPLESRFNVACFGLLGYELDPTKLSDNEKLAVKEQIKFYKKYRKLFQFGDFFRIKDGFESEHAVWEVVSADKKQSISGFFQKLFVPNPPSDKLFFKGLDEELFYKISCREQYLEFVPGRLSDDEGFLSNKEEYGGYGDLLMNGGIKLNQQYPSIRYNQGSRLMGDFGSRLYIARSEEEK
jgi:alpha-galactosidase